MTGTRDTRAQMLEVTLPHNAEAERVILGSILLDNSLVYEAESLLKTPEKFYVRAHKFIFVAMMALAEAGIEINPITVCDELRRRETFEQVGGIAFVSELSYGLPQFTNLATYAEMVNRAERRRWLVRLGNELTNRALGDDAEEGGIAEWCDEQIINFRAEAGDTGRTVNYVPALVGAQVERFRRFFRNESDAVPTGFAEIDDNVTGRGLMRSMLHLLAGRPSAGKTSFALDITANVIASGLNVYFASLEMAKEVLLDRLFAVDALVARWKIQPGMYRSDLERLEESADRFRAFNLFIDDRSRSADAMRRAVRDIERGGRKVDLIVVDYLQLMDTSRGGGSRNDKVGENSRHLQSMAKEFKLPLLALSQLSRACEQQGREPELSDLRDSGELEQDARTVFFLFGDKSEEDISNADAAYVKPLFRDITLKCAKQGEGKLFRAALPFQTELMTFRATAQMAAAPVREMLQDVEF